LLGLVIDVVGGRFQDFAFGEVESSEHGVGAYIEDIDQKVIVLGFEGKLDLSDGLLICVYNKIVVNHSLCVNCFIFGFVRNADDHKLIFFSLPNVDQSTFDLSEMVGFSDGIFYFDDPVFAFRFIV
jgi:hypothetical protein